MATSKIPSLHVSAITLAESTGTKTFAEHLLTLYSAYAAASSAQRQKMAIVENSNSIYRIAYTENTPSFSRTVGATSTNLCSIECIRVNSSSASVTKWDITTTGITKTSRTDENISGSVKLVYDI